MSSEIRYEVVEGWEQLPAGYLHRDVVGVGVDSRDRVYLLTRNDPRVLVYEPDGSFVMSWKEGMFRGRTHGIRIAPDDSVFVVDDADHIVRKFSPTGELLMTLGIPGVPSDTGYDAALPATAPLDVKLETITHGGGPFNRPTNVAVAPNGDLYISDGYANCQVHHFTGDGKLIQSWGEPGTGPGQFHLPHDVWVTEDGRVLVADRENERIQIFDLEGNYLEEWADVTRPTGIFIKDGLIYVSENARRHGLRSFRFGVLEEDLPGRVSIFDMKGKLVHRWGNLDRTDPGQFCAPHCICVDSRGDLYVGEVTWTDWGSKGYVPEGTHMFQKFARK